MSELFRLSAENTMQGEFRGGLLGWPVSHSLSPAIHSLFLKHYGIAGSYTLLPVKPENLSDFFAGFTGGWYTGLNVTIPFKKRVIDLCNSLSPEAEESGAVNTLVFTKNRIKGFNTDVTGFRKMSAELPSPFFVFGTGGAAAAVSMALKEKEVSLISRGGSFPSGRKPAVATVVNATPLGWNDNDVFPIDIPRGWYFADLNYNSRWNWRNRLHSPVVTGEVMLVEQASESFKLWTGYNPGRELKAEALERIREIINGR